MSSDLSAPVVGAHHGAMLFGAFYAIRNLPDVFAGIEYLVETEEV